ncbi:MAG: N4-gp56 family major capsid protein [Chloroflexi bacterium]|nr:N4-gp56 family major capsid protein [Chloroflexota bacterium]
MAMDLLGAAGLTIGMKQFYNRKLLERAVPSFIHAGHGDKSGIPRNEGKSVEFRRYERPTAATVALTEGTPPSVTNLTISNVQATVDQYGAFNRHSELVALQNYDPFLASWSEMWGEHMGDTIDILARNIITAGTTVQIASTVASRGAVGGTTAHRITYAEIREAVSTLRNNNAKPVVDNKFLGLIHHHTEAEMFADSDILASFQQAYVRGPGNPLVQGEVGDFYGVRWLTSSNARVFGSEGASGADVYGTLIFGRQFYGEIDYEAMGSQMIVKPVGSAGGLDPLDQMGTHGWKAAYVAVITNQSWGVRIEHTTRLGAEGV